ncbi:MAG: hypothetical protein AAF621_05445 [Pseudomonadota bacterium]
MTNQAPWSIKGVDAKTRQEMKKIAQETGMTLGELLAQLLSRQDGQLDISHDETQTNSQPETSSNDAQEDMFAHLPIAQNDTKEKKEETESQDLPKEDMTDKADAKKVEAPKFTANKPVKKPARKAPSAKSTAKKPTRKKTVSKAQTKSSQASQPTTKPKESGKSVFETLLGRPSIVGSRSSLSKTTSEISVHQMAKDSLEEMVIEGRDLRSALRAHTKELSKEIRKDVEASISHQLLDIRDALASISQRSSQQQPIGGTGENLEDTRSLISETVSQHISALKDYVDQRTDMQNQTDPQMMTSMMEKIGNDLMASFENKLNGFMSHMMAGQGGAQGLDPENAAILSDNIQQVVNRLVTLEQTCQNLQAPVYNVDNPEDAQKFIQIQQEISHFIHDMPQRIKDVLESDLDMHGIKNSLSTLANRIEVVEGFTQNLPDMAPAQQRQPSMQAPAQPAPQAVTNTQMQFDEDEFDTVTSSNIPSSQAPQQPAPQRHAQPEANAHPPQSEQFDDGEFEEVVQENPQNNFQSSQHPPQANQEEYYDDVYDDIPGEEFDNVSLQDLDEWDSEYENSDELGFDQEDLDGAPYDLDGAHPQSSAAQKKSPSGIDIRSFDHQTMLNRTKKNAMQQLHQRNYNQFVSDNEQSTVAKILSNFQPGDNKKNALIVGGVVLTICAILVVLLTV